MREVAQFRIPEEHARRFLQPTIGRRLGDSVRLVEAIAGGELYEEIGTITRKLREDEGEPFFLGWEVRRQYSQVEVSAAELFTILISTAFEPAGEECGTEYDYSHSCPICGAGRILKSGLRLRTSRIPNTKDLAKTIAGDEWVLSQRLADTLLANSIRGADFPPIEHTDGTPDPKWRHLRVTSRPVRTAERTRFGIAPFKEDRAGEYLCPLGHRRGLNALSELWLFRDDWDGSDVLVTEEYVGGRRGLLVPRRMLVVTPKVFQLLKATDAKGYHWEIAHFV